MMDVFEGASAVSEPEQDEIDLYTAEPACAKDANPLHWWKMNEARFPGVARLAKKYLSVQATSAPSERVFSNVGNILTKKRSRLVDRQLKKKIPAPLPCLGSTSIFAKQAL